MSYLLKKYGPQISNKLAISKLGIRKLYASALSENFSYKKHKIISVSGCVAIKRIHLIIDLIAKLRTIGLPIEWHHIGGGELLNKLVNYAQVHLQSDFLFYGYQTNGQVQEILANNNYTAFISCTFSEGGNPVSMQEAQAYALPIIATNVGGVPEVLADYDCGWLLERDFDLENVAKRLSHDLNNAEIMKRKSQDAYKSYLAKYYTQFCKALLEL